MSDDNPVTSIVAKYVDNDSIGEAITAAEQEMFEELRRWEKGAPTAVMFAANLAATEAMIRFLVHMAIDALSHVHGWDEVVSAEQELLAYAALRLVREDKMLETVKLMRPTDG